MNTSANLEDKFAQVFGPASSGTGEEELLRIVSDYTLQLSARQIRALLRISMKAEFFEMYGKKRVARMLRKFYDSWLKLKIIILIVL